MKKGFTLLELLIVIGILAILATAVTLVLNPAELLKQARDGNRLNDLRALNNALGLFIVASSTLPIDSFYCSNASGGQYVTSTAPASCGNNAITAVNGTGWVNVNFASMQGGSPLSRLPLDPINTASSSAYIYRSNSDGSKFELNANMESAKYSVGGTNDVESNTKDGGDNAGLYEIGASLNLF